MNPVSLLFYLSPKSSYRQVLVSSKEVFCSPDDVDRCVAGQYQTMQTPVGQFDVKEIVDRLPPEQYPELVVVKADASARCVPRGLDQLKCPKVLVLGDTHHLPNPISFLIKYARLESFDLLVSDHDRHHLPFFQRAGFSNVQWIPALNYCMRPRPIGLPRVNGGIFVGQLGVHHPYRRSLFGALIDSGAPVNLQTAHPEQAANLYAEHALALNCSLNGDLNLRIFEVMGSGGLLLTDRLSRQSGLSHIFEDGVHLVEYSSLGELQEKVDH